MARNPILIVSDTLLAGFIGSGIVRGLIKQHDNVPDGVPNSLSASGLLAHTITLKLEFDHASSEFVAAEVMQRNSAKTPTVPRECLLRHDNQQVAGQTLRTAGADLRTSCFSHGQLYVACSSVTSCTELFVLLPAGETHNVVYREILH
ncbi:uncharacterized protein [Choristoneura fumiferana]|uniref:uncharacterized protein n=1 Tax=Choristoneura fumiferana TaxID=7141 RepID=UPI003D157826